VLVVLVAAARVVTMWLVTLVHLTEAAVVAAVVLMDQPLKMAATAAPVLLSLATPARSNLAAVLSHHLVAIPFTHSHPLAA